MYALAYLFFIPLFLYSFISIVALGLPFAIPSACPAVYEGWS